MKKRLLSILVALALCLTLLPTTALAEGPDVEEKYTVIYTDGVENEEIFEDRRHSNLSVGDQTPAFSGNLERAGYEFDGWSPTVETTVKAENADKSNVITYTATWCPADRNQNGILDIEEKFTVIFTDGVIGADVWPDQISPGLSVGDVIPSLTSYPSRPGCAFDGWNPTPPGIVVAPAEGNVIIYTARWTRGGNYPLPLTQEVQVNYYDETENKQVAEVDGVVVAFDATYVPAYLISEHLPDGYMVKDGLRNVPLDAGASSVSVSVEKIPTTKVVKISYYNEISQEQVAEAELEVPLDATCVNTSALKAPAGYELAATGDLPIQDGYVHAAVRKVIQTGESSSSRKYTLKYDTNEGNTISSERKSRKWTKDFEDLPVPTRKGYEFAGWYYNENLTQKVEDDVVVDTTTVILYAKWVRVSELPFTDVAVTDYYYDAVLWAAENGITGGVDDTHFAPNAPCTRAQIVTFLWRAAGSPAPKSSDMPFEDVAAGSYYHDAVLWAVEQGITVGTSATTFSPDDTCTRAHIVTFLWRAQQSPAAGSANPFLDVASDAYYTDAVLWAVKNGITVGTNAAGTTFSPDDDCTRAQIVTFLFRCLGDE